MSHKSEGSWFADGEAYEHYVGRWNRSVGQILDWLSLPSRLRWVDVGCVTDFDDYWSPFLRGQGPAGAYCTSLLETDRERLRMHLENTLPINADGTIDLIALAWAIRGIV